MITYFTPASVLSLSFLRNATKAYDAIEVVSRPTNIMMMSLAEATIIIPAVASRVNEKNSARCRSFSMYLEASKHTNADTERNTSENTAAKTSNVIIGVPLNTIGSGYPSIMLYTTIAALIKIPTKETPARPLLDFTRR